MNRPKDWDKMLSDSLYLGDYGEPTKKRVKYISRNICGTNVLNVGSGQGYLEKESLEKKVYNWISLDISLSGLRRIQERYNTKQVLGSLLGLPIKSACIDTVICSEVLEHISESEVDTAYCELVRVMKNTGTLLISVPVFEPMSLVKHPVGHVRKLTPPMIENEINSHGLQIVNKKTIYAFNRFNGFLSFLVQILELRRPSVCIYVCKKI